MIDINQCSGRTLAFLGDAVWSLKVREALVEEDGVGKGKRLQKLSISYVSAKAQASFYQALHAENFFTSQEEDVFHRGRNANEGSVPKNTDVQTYRLSTGFEAILGALHIQKNERRIQEIFEKVRNMQR